MGIEQHAEDLLEAEAHSRPIPLVSASIPDLDVRAAYWIQKEYIAGTPLLVGNLGLDTVAVALHRDGTEILTGRGSDAMGGQWETALWLVNSLIDRGWQLRSGQILITGALGKMVPAHPGKYRAQFGPLDTVSFEIR